MSQAIDRISHSCGTRQGLRVFADEDGKINGFCFACNQFVAHPYGTPKTVGDLPPPKVKTQAEINAELAEVDGYQTLDLKQRKLRAATLSEFGIKVAVSEEDGTTPQAFYMPLTRKGKVVAYKVKTLNGEGGNKTWMIGDGKDVDLFNWENAKKSGAYRLIVTEGEADACAVARIYELHGDEKYKPAVVSLQYGAGRARESLQKHVKEIKSLFKEVVLCFDNDGPGQEAVKKAMLVLPDAKSVTLPEKDANDCLIEGKSKAAFTALSYQASKPKNSRLVFGEEVHEKAKEPAKYGELTWPWHQLNQDLRGIRYGETIYLGAGTKSGKTTVKNALSAHFMKEHDTKVFMACPEEANEMSYKLLANQLTGKIFHDPEIDFDEAAYEEAGKILKKNLYMLNIYQHLGWQSLKEDIVAAASEGCKIMMIDPITNITNGVNSAEANTVLQEVAQDLSAMALDFNFTVMLFAHLKAPEGQISQQQRQQYYGKGQYLDLGNCSHEMGGSVYSNQFAGSRAMQRSCHLMLGLLANKDPELPEEIRNTRQIRVLEDRNWGSSGKYNLFYNKNTGKFVET